MCTPRHKPKSRWKWRDTDDDNDGDDDNDDDNGDKIKDDASGAMSMALLANNVAGGQRILIRFLSTASRVQNRYKFDDVLNLANSHIFAEFYNSPLNSREVRNESQQGMSAVAVEVVKIAAHGGVKFELSFFQGIYLITKSDLSNHTIYMK